MKPRNTTKSLPQIASGGHSACNESGQPKRRQPLLLYAIAIYWAALFLATHLPARSLVSVPSYNDKVVHFGGYLLLSILLASNLHSHGLCVFRATTWTVLATMLYGAFDELTQLPIPGRNGDINDWLADSCGAVVGATLFAVAVRWLGFSRAPQSTN